MTFYCHTAEPVSVQCEGIITEQNKFVRSKTEKKYNIKHNFKSSWHPKLLKENKISCHKTCIC